uniref:Uncharacterized protein n=1 Tax=Glossina palpalis gambiensis TaxID=67801 RepID=A0A1B0BS03_9MUSC
MLFDAFRMAAAAVVSTPKPLTSLFVFQRLKRLDATSLPESGESSRNLNFPICDGLITSAGDFSLFSLDNRRIRKFWGTSVLEEFIFFSVELSITCTFIKARPYCTCLLKGCVQTILTNDHLLLATAGTKASWLKQRTRFIFVEFLLSTGVINEHNASLRIFGILICPILKNSLYLSISILLKISKPIVIIKSCTSNAVAFVYFELCKYSLLRNNITDQRHRFLEQQIPKICIFVVSKLCCIKSSSILSSSEEGHDIRMHFIWPTIVVMMYSMSFNTSIPEADIKNVLIIDILIEFELPTSYFNAIYRNNIRETFVIDETKRIIQMLYS